MARGNGYRGLWIALGATLALLTLVALGLVLPRIFATHASQKASPPAVAPADTQSAAAATPTLDAGSAAPNARAPAVSPPTATTESAGVTSTPEQAGPGSTGAAAGTVKPRPQHAPQQTQVDSTASQLVATQVNQPVAPPGPSPKEIRDAHDRCSNLQARADAALSNLQQLRAQQQAQGVDLRGDVVAGMSRMQIDLNEALHYLNQNDLATAGEYMDRADREITSLERFLGR